MTHRNWNIRFSAPKPQRDPESPALDENFSEVALDDNEPLSGGAEPDTDPNRPL